jgi:hypothetical protein
VIADRRALPWIAEFLNDRDPGIQASGIGVLDQLLWSELLEPGEAESLMKAAEQHQNEHVRERANFIRDYLGAREGADDGRRETK